MKRAILLIATGTLLAQTPPPSPDLVGHYQTAGASGVTLSASALYWQPREEGLDYVIQSALVATGIRNAGEVRRVPWDWNWGWRAELGYQEPCRKMDLNGRWTHYATEGEDSRQVVFPDQFWSVWSIPITTSPTAYEYQAAAHSHLAINIGDLGLKTTFSPRPFLDLSPSLELSSLWIHQKIRLDLAGGLGLNGHPVVNDEIQLKSRFWGIGPKAGLDTLWNLGYGIGICGNCHLSLLYGLFKVRQNETVAYDGLTPDNVYLDISKNDIHITKLTLDVMLGLRYDAMFFQESLHMTLEAGWENQIFFGQNQWMRFPNASYLGVNSADCGDLTIQGLTLRAAFAF